MNITITITITFNITITITITITINITITITGSQSSQLLESTSSILLFCLPSAAGFVGMIAAKNCPMYTSTDMYNP